MVKIFRQFYKVLIITLGQICKNLFLQFYVTTITYPNTLLLSYVKLLIMYTDFLYSWWKNMQAQRNIFKLSGGMPEAYILGVICPLDWNRINKHVKINCEKKKSPLSPFVPPGLIFAEWKQYTTYVSYFSLNR